jgi:hypothetical protein
MEKRHVAEGALPSGTAIAFPIVEAEMRHLTRTTTLLFVAMLWIGSPVDAQVSIGIRIGPPPAPRVVRVQPRRPGPDYVWIEGYWYPAGNRYQWHNGYWTRPPYAGARWVAPHHDGQQFFTGYWEGDRGRLEHDHRWDRSRARDYDRRDRR